MNKRIKFDVSTLALLFVVLSIVVITVVSIFVNDRRGGLADDTTLPPEITFAEVPVVPQRGDIQIAYSERSEEDFYIKDNVEYIYSYVSYPYLDGGNAEATAKINQALYIFAIERVTIESFEKTNAEDAYARAQKEATGFIPFEFVTRVESVFVKNGYVSIMFKRTRTVGINEPSEFLTTMCFDLLSGEEVDLSDFMNSDDESALEFLLNVFTQHININPMQYYNDALETLRDVVDLKSFYLFNNGVVFYVNPDVITPSVMGVREITVPYDKIGY